MYLGGTRANRRSYAWLFRASDASKPVEGRRAWPERFDRAGSGRVNAAAAESAKSVIFLHQFGGPSHVDTFDMKPAAPAEVRGEYSAVRTSAPGIQICDRLPRMARLMDKVTLIRSVRHEMKNHNSAGYYSLTARAHRPTMFCIRIARVVRPMAASSIASLLVSRAHRPSSPIRM